MADTLVRVTEAVLQSLVTSGLPFDEPPVRAYIPIYDLKTFKLLKVTVVPFVREYAEQAARDSDFVLYGVHVALQKKVPPPQDTVAHLAACDALMQLVEDTIHYLRNKDLTLTGPDETARFVPLPLNRPVFVQDMMDTLHQFTSVIEVNYRLRK